MTGADVDRYSFTVMDLHNLLLAGLYRRSPRCSGYPVWLLTRHFNPQNVLWLLDFSGILRLISG